MGCRGELGAGGAGPGLWGPELGPETGHRGAQRGAMTSVILEAWGTLQVPGLHCRADWRNPHSHAAGHFSTMAQPLGCTLHRPAAAAPFQALLLSTLAPTREGRVPGHLQLTSVVPYLRFIVLRRSGARCCGATRTRRGPPSRAA